MKQAILVISFGTSYIDTCRKTIAAIEADIANAFPDMEMRRAFTSQFIINKLKKRDGIFIDTVEEALEKLAKEGFKTVVCQPTHIMNGHEYDKLSAAIKPFEEKFDALVIGRPLLSQAADYQALTTALKNALPTVGTDELFLLMGHGTTHFADAAYAALSHHFRLQGLSHFLIATVEGFPLLEDVISHIEERKPKKIYLAPLMVVAGDHALNDMAGTEEDSWTVRLAEKGFQTEPILKGIGEYPAVRKIYVNHTQDAFNQIKQCIK